MSFYIIREDASAYPVWNYRLNCWAADLDAAYDEGFEYTTRDAANRRLKALRLTTRERLSVVTREYLFLDVVKVRDWSRPAPYADPARLVGRTALELAQRPLF